jgi:wyosine [tRNA(Phe)-imidazoG37] synthetase (radical SAM superfamily)
MDAECFVPADRVVEEIRERVAQRSPDVITLAGSGEPTLYSDIDRVIASVKEFTETPVVLLTNGSLMWKEEIRGRVLEADIIMPTLTSACDSTFRRIHRPCKGIELPAVVEGLRLLRREYKGRLHLEVVLLAGINDTPAEVEGLASLTRELTPEKIQINTVVRPPADPSAEAVPADRLDEIQGILGDRAEIIADISRQTHTGPGKNWVGPCMDMVRRRPLRSVDIANALNLPLDEVEDLIGGLVLKGYVRRREHLGEIYYLRNEDDILE